MADLVLRRLWSIYKKILVEDGCGRRNQVLAQDAFYAGGRSVLKVLDFMIEADELDKVRRTIQKHGRTIKALQGSRARARRH